MPINLSLLLQKPSIPDVTEVSTSLSFILAQTITLTWKEMHSGIQSLDLDAGVNFDPLILGGDSHEVNMFGEVTRQFPDHLRFSFPINWSNQQMSNRGSKHAYLYCLCTLEIKINLKIANTEPGMIAGTN